MVPRKYQPHIDGLRAIAVMAVIAFHYGATWLPGGFTGVDVFFVISGFLITGNVWTAIQQQRFSMTAFYAGRIRRILPALLLLVISTMAVASFVLTPGDMSSLATSAKYSSFGFGNFFFYGNTGYFDREADLQPLLHLWSLGVEEQFYLIWPIVLIALGGLRPTRHTACVLFAVLSFVGLVYSQYAIGTDPKAAFYLPASRAWELLLGATMAVAPKITSPTMSRLANISGAGLVATSLLLISHDQPFPGIFALPAVAGAGLLVAAKRDDILATLLSFGPLVWVGKISYSLYLWHWPVLVVFRHYANGGEPTKIEAAMLVAIAFICACASWAFVETPLRRTTQFKLPSLLLGALAMIVTSLSANYVTAAVGGLVSAPSDEARSVESLGAMWEWQCPQRVSVPGINDPQCAFGSKWETSPQKLILWGDSHADHLAPLVESSLPPNVSVLLVDNCPAALGGSITRHRLDMPDYENECARRRQAVFDISAHDAAVKGVILAGSWGPLLPDLSGGPSGSTGLSRLEVGIEEAVAGVPSKVVLVGQVPRTDLTFVECRIAEAFNRIRRTCPDPQPVFDATLRKYGLALDSLFQSIAVKSPHRVSAISVKQGLCGDGRCLVEINGEMIYRDSIHLRRNLTQKTKVELAHRIGLPDALDWLLR